MVRIHQTARRQPADAQPADTQPAGTQPLDTQPARPTRTLHWRRAGVVGACAAAVVIPAGGAWATAGHGTYLAARHPMRPITRRVTPNLATLPAPVTWNWGTALHGDLVLPSGTSTQEVFLQRGQITAVTDTTITVTSTDGTATTWALGTSTTIANRTVGRRWPSTGTTPTPSPSTVTGALTDGEQVDVWGTGTSSSPTATDVIVVPTPPSPTPAASPATTVTETVTPTVTATVTPTVTATVTPTVTATVTPTVTQTVTPTS